MANNARSETHCNWKNRHKSYFSENRRANLDKDYQIEYFLPFSLQPQPIMHFIFYFLPIHFIIVFTFSFLVVRLDSWLIHSSKSITSQNHANTFGLEYKTNNSCKQIQSRVLIPKAEKKTYMPFDAFDHV